LRIFAETIYYSLALKSNKIFHLGALIFISIATIVISCSDHGDSIIWFSGNRTQALNLFFTTITKVGEEWSYVLLLIILLFYRFRYALMVFVLAILVPAISMSLKKFFACPRPKKFFTDNGLFDSLDIIEGVSLYTGHSSFPSGHTISAFAVMGFASFVFSRYKWSSTALIVLAILVALSRVYMVQHFLLDVCVGAAIGCGIALFTSWISIKIQSPKGEWLEKNLLNLKKQLPKV
jgi:membrane-associated phospholipid phosphatase